MEKIARDFYSEEKIQFSGIEEQITFFIDNYPEIMRKFRMAKECNENVKRRKEWANAELKILRRRIEELQKSAKHLTEREKIEIEERQNFLQDLRERDETVMYNGKEMTLDEVTYLFKYRRILSIVEKIDYKGRVYLVNIINTISPVKRKKRKKGTSKSFCNFMVEVVEEIKEKIMP